MLRYRNVFFYNPICRNSAIQNIIMESGIKHGKPTPDKPKQVATKAPRHEAKPLVNIHLCVFVSWWRKCFATKCTKIAAKVRIMDNSIIVTSLGIGVAIFAGLVIFWFFNAFVKRKLGTDQSVQLATASQKSSRGRKTPTSPSGNFLGGDVGTSV